MKIRGIYVNQSGYLPGDRKRAVINFKADEFRLISKSGEVCFCGKTEYFGFDECSGDNIWIADFSEFAKAGKYKIQAGENSSFDFEISEKCRQTAFDRITKAYYYFRCGCELEEKYAGKFTHDKCHSANAVLWDNHNVTLEVNGGWHDAGDYGRYVTAAACALAHLLNAFKLFKKVFEKQDLNIPESGNGLPDILNECRYELEWLLKMQRPDGSVYHKVTTALHAPFIMPEKDTAQMYVFPVSSMATADLAAVCALASGIYSEYDKRFASRLLSAAKLSYKWLSENPGFIGFSNPEGCNTGPYGERTDIDNRFWAAAELYNISGEDRYYVDMTRLAWEDFPVADLGYGSVGGFGAMSCLFGTMAYEVELYDKFKTAFIGEAEYLKNLSDNCGYSAAMTPRDFYWGSNMQLLKRAMIFAIADMIEGGERFAPYASAQLDYLMGVNATGYSFVTGCGENAYKNPHLRPAAADGIDECIPGMVSGGPNRYPGDPTAERIIPKDTPPMKCYADHVDCYSLNEVTIYWNSPAVFLLAYLLDRSDEGEAEQ